MADTPSSTLTLEAGEEGTYIINVAFEDEDGTAVAPVSMTWTLTDLGGTIINSREDVPVSTPTASEDIVLSGDDLALQAGETTEEKVHRKFTVSGTYDSSLGAGLPWHSEVVFPIRALLKVP